MVIPFEKLYVVASVALNAVAGTVEAALRLASTAAVLLACGAIVAVDNVIFPTVPKMTPVVEA